MKLGTEFRPEGIAGSVAENATLEECGKILFYRSYLTGPDGARYELFRETRQTDEDVKRAKAYLRRNFDVVSISIIKETK